MYNLLSNEYVEFDILLKIVLYFKKNKFNLQNIFSGIAQSFNISKNK